MRDPFTFGCGGSLGGLKGTMRIFRFHFLAAFVPSTCTSCGGGLASSGLGGFVLGFGASHAATTTPKSHANFMTLKAAFAIGTDVVVAAAIGKTSE